MRQIFVLVVAMSTSAFAQQEKVQPPTKEIRFDDDLIEAGTDQPDGEYLKHCTRDWRPRLIKVPSEFKDKVLDSARDL